jgi:hypothetical protein
MKRGLLVVGACGLGFGIVACGGETTSTSSGGTGELYVHSFVPTAGSSVGASFDRRVTFTDSPCATPSVAVGPCTLNGCYQAGTTAESSSPNGGAITIDGAEMPPLTLVPQADGYAPSVVGGQRAWTSGGETVRFAWASLPGDDGGGGAVTLATPPYVALAEGSAFASSTPSLSRSVDLTIAWTSDSPPVAADQLAVDLASGSSQLVCIFDASAGNGVIPAAALQLVPAGAGTYDVHSKEGATKKSVAGTAWTLGFNVDAQARASDGLAKGATTFE